MQSQGRKLIDFCKRMIWILFLIIIAYLLTASVFSTCYLGAFQYTTMSGKIEFNMEHTFYMSDAVWPHMVVFCFFSVLLYVLGRKKREFSLCRKIIPGFLLVVIFACLIWIIWVSQYYPSSDQQSVVEAAAAFYAGDYSVLAPGEYIFLYPHQFGITLYFWGLCVIFGGMNYVAFQFVNAVIILLSYILLAKTFALLANGGKKLDAGMLATALLFVPSMFYVTFLYGTVVGFLFAILSYYCMLSFLKEGKGYLLLMGGLSMALAVLFRSNFLIFLIAALIYLAGSVLENKGIDSRKARRALLFGLVIGICCIAVKWGTNWYLTSLNEVCK